MDLDELIRRRRALEVDLAVHEASLRCFWPQDMRPSFVIAQAELAGLAPDTGGKPLHLTSSASCFESLADREPRFASVLAPGTTWRGVAEKFAMRSLETPPSGWMSDEAAHVYCRVRTLPAVLRFAPKLRAGLGKAARSRLVEAFQVIDSRRSSTDRGLGERVLEPDGSVKADAGSELYPANAFHAYWGARANSEYLARAKGRADVPSLPAAHDERVAANYAWAFAAMTRQTALILADKTRGDAQQLVFALLADLIASGGQATPASERFDLYDAALCAFFKAQQPSGRWPPSTPLFHYPQSGNAYCYTFETLTELLRPALPREDGRGLRALLEPHLSRLFRAWDYAMETRVPLADARGDGYGWSSHHHVTRDDPEAWATAEVFAFGQLLRCVSGHVVAEAAAGDVKARRPEYASRAAAEKELGSRGSTWAPDRWTVGRQLAAMFLHPVRMPRAEDDKDVRDPDAPVIGLDNARSAVLYGPPGTGKTTIVEALAGALGWQFVEVLASDFLSAGIDAVPARADAIFDRLMQLDRCVILFDEIDELIRDRRDEASDPFGRFLTTSMLPKIAKLWKQRRVIFFVATNHVSKADPAITRSSRFDASIFVAPPGLSVKRRLLADSLKAKAPRFDDSDVTQALEAGSAGDLPDHHRALAVLPLLRYDQMSELAIRLHRTHGVVSPGAFAKALVDVGKELLDHEWQPARKIEDWDAKDTVARLLAVYQEYVDERRHDFSRDWVLTVSSAAKECAPSSWQKLAHAKGETFFRCPNALTLHPETTHGELTLEGPAGTATDRRILAFDAPPA